MSMPTYARNALNLALLSVQKNVKFIGAYCNVRSLSNAIAQQDVCMYVTTRYQVCILKRAVAWDFRTLVPSSIDPYSNCKLILQSGLKRRTILYFKLGEFSSMDGKGPEQYTVYINIFLVDCPLKGTVAWYSFSKVIPLKVLGPLIHDLKQFRI
jgi:hypothetical protein